ncbi:Glycosyltransferase AER61, uncharacterized [Phytophthora cactorum]|nr:Glycosyltransferase AER61, uncharacterized [Phytophthora cactorum]
MTMYDQMKAMLDSDVEIGMHGAGMFNVLWTRPETLVIEIFPRRRFRWGYRNICQYIGCKWHDFRRGRDIGIHSSIQTIWTSSSRIQSGRASSTHCSASSGQP